MEKRLLLAAALSLGVLVLWEAIAAKNAPHPVKTPGSAPTAVAAAPATVPSGAGQAAAVVPAAPAAPAAALEPVAAAAEQTTVLSNDLVRATVSNRGAVLSSYVLVKHTDEQKRPLELVRQVPAPAPRPLAIDFPGRPDLTARAAQALYTVEPLADRGVRLKFSDGALSITKEIRLGTGYLFDVRTSVAGAAPYTLLVGTGLRNDADELVSRYSPPAAALATSGNGFERARPDKLEKPQTWPLADHGYAGLEDNYFLAVLLPRQPATAAALPVPGVGPITGKDAAAKPGNGITAGVTASGPLDARAYFGPKDVEVLESAHLGLERTVDFGWYGILARPLLWLLKRTYGLVGNFGVAILLVTLLIRILLFPLMHKSYSSMKKMQKLAPRMNAIKDKYKKAKTDAAQRAKMNEEIMKLYQTEGYNPMSGCFPVLLQLPILVAFYNVLSRSIELRHAPFVLWIRDLSAVDHTYVLLILMIVSMYVQQAMTPTTADPAQKKIFMAMPLLWGFFLKDMPSGLVLYWLFSNVLTIFQQMIINKMASGGEPAPEPKKLRQARA
ncbi:MAG: membrane protein insertase YidC [Acidobacteria bacterium]|nr:membrane protein insertase YidC [Acidobacteriota bacterium]